MYWYILGSRYFGLPPIFNSMFDFWQLLIICSGLPQGRGGNEVFPKLIGEKRELSLLSCPILNFITFMDGVC